MNRAQKAVWIFYVIGTLVAAFFMCDAIQTGWGSNMGIVGVGFATLNIVAFVLHRLLASNQRKPSA